MPGVSNYDAYTGLTRPIGLCLGLPLVLVLRPLYDWGGLGPKKTQKWFHDPEKPKKTQNWSGRSPKSSEMVHKKLGDGAVNPKKLRNGEHNRRSLKGSEMVREKPPKKAQKWSGNRPGLRNGPGGAQKGSEKVRKAYKRLRNGAKMAQKWSGGSPEGSEMVRTAWNPWGRMDQCGVTKHLRFRVILFGARLTLACGLNPSRRGPRSPRATAPSPCQAKARARPRACRHVVSLAAAYRSARGSLQFRV